MVESSPQPTKAGELGIPANHQYDLETVSGDLWCFTHPCRITRTGISAGHHRVARLMRQTGIRGKTTCKRRPHTTEPDPSHSVTANVLDRLFSTQRTDEVWLTDITYIDTAEGYLYLAAVMDLYSWQIVGMTMADHLRAELVEIDLDMALTQRCPPCNLLHHSDRGNQYMSIDYQKRLTASYIIVSISRIGNCWDNIYLESFWATLKHECADVGFASHTQARLSSSVTS